MRYLVLILLYVISISCKDEVKQERETEQNGKEPARETVEKEPVDYQSFSSEEWGVGFEYPETYEVYDGEFSTNSPVINIYPSIATATLPLGIYEEAGVPYIALFPKGYSGDGPAGKSIPVREWEGGLPITFSIDEENSTVYLLENNEPWGYLLHFHQAPEKWNGRGSIFIRLCVKDFKAVCMGMEDGREIIIKDCDPTAGDEVKYYGEVKQEAREEVNSILRSLYFFSDSSRGESLPNLIEVEMPAANSKITSPVQIKGKARGYWFFEADAPIELVDVNYKLLARGHITAIGDWMTEDFVPFEASLDFEIPSAKKGYLIMRRSNASGLPEHDRAFFIPVNFK